MLLRPSDAAVLIPVLQELCEWWDGRAWKMLRVPETWVEVGHVVVLESGQDTGILVFL